MIGAQGRSPRKPRGRGAERREEILDAAQNLFARQGVFGVSTREIAASLGLSQPALYTHFRNKEDILAELVERAFSELGRRMIALPVAEVTGRAALLRMGRIYIDFGLEQPDAYRIAFMLEKRRSQAESLHPRILAAGRDIFEDFQSRVAQLVSAGLTRPGEARLLTQSLWAGLHGLVSLLLARSQFSWDETETLITRHLELLADGVLAAEPLSPRR
ncbi:MAG: TetR/AcrR family transcriptional regulator [Phenylobacterium sp.]